MKQRFSNRVFALVCGMILFCSANAFAAEWVKISGTVYYNGQPLCVMVLANGEYMFTDATDGRYDMTVPLDANGEITLFSFCDGLAPYKAVLKSWEAGYFEINMVTALPGSEGINLSVTHSSSSKTGWVKISGTATYNDAPLCVMILANGQHIFTPAETGKYELEIPLDLQGNITLFGFCDGMQPYKKEWNNSETVWYKDYDGDGYSDGTSKTSDERPAGHYTDSELIAIAGDTNDYDTNIHPETIKIEYSMPSLQLTTTIGYNGNEQTVISSSSPSSVHTGEPVLPVIPAMVVLQNGYEFDHVEIETGEKITLSGKHTVEHGQQQYPLLPDITPVPTLQDNTVYGSDSPYPAKLYDDSVGVQKLAGVSILMVNLNPVEYKPLSGQLSYYKTLSLKVITNPESESRKKESIRANPSAVLSRFKVDNSEMLETYSSVSDYDAVSGYEALPRNLNSDGSAVIHDEAEPIFMRYEAEPRNKRAAGLCDPSDSYKYVLITSQAIKDATTTPNVNDLIAQRQAQGISATVVAVEDIYADYSGVDNAEKVRNFIIDAYNNWETEFVLLGGDTNIIPMRKLYCKSWDGWDAEVDEIPSDLYYQCLDGNYNSDGDSRWGEPNDGENGKDVDLLAEIYVGRASAENTTEISNFVYKTLGYENDNSSYKKSVLMVGEELGFGGESEYATGSMEEIKSGSSKHGFTSAGFAEDSSYTVGTLYDSENYEWNKSELVSKINSGAYSIINHLGHANYNYVMKLVNSDADALGNSKFMFAYSQGCIPGNFEENCIAEHLTNSTRNGMFAVVFNSRYGWGAMNSTDGASQRYNREFWDAFFAENMTYFGKMNADSHEDNLWRINESCMRWCYYESNLLGDPATSFVSQENKGNPVANAGVDKTVNEGDTVTLNGSGTDSGGYIVSYEWEKISGPGLTLSNTASANFTFTAPQVDSAGATLMFKLTVKDDDGLTGTDTCNVYVKDKGGSDIVVFPDENLEAAIREAINKPSGDILKSDLEKLSSLGYSGYDKPDTQKIKNIEGIQYCKNLTSFYLPQNQISDISPVAGLSSLTLLSLWGNQISDISPVAGLKNLTELYLYWNQISDISAVAGLKNLTVLYLGTNQITDISPLARLTNLTTIAIMYNQISDISSLEELINLTWLWLYGNNISDIKPLIDNNGIGSGDKVYLYFEGYRGNPLSTTSCTVYIPQLQSRGVTVEHDCP